MKPHISVMIAILLLAATKVPAAEYFIGPKEAYKTFYELISEVQMQPGDVVDGGQHTFNEIWNLGTQDSLNGEITMRNATISGFDAGGHSHLILQNLSIKGPAVFNGSPITLEQVSILPVLKDYEYLLDDEFVTSESLPFGEQIRICSPGPGSLRVNSGEGKTEIRFGSYLANGGSGKLESAGWHSAVAYDRVPGLVWVMNGALQSGSAAGLWRSDSFRMYDVGLGFRNNYGTRMIYVNAHSIQLPIAAPLEEGYAIVLKQTGAWFFCRINGNWELMHDDTTSSSQHYYATLLSGAASMSSDKVAVARTLPSITVDTAKSYLELFYHEIGTPDGMIDDYLLKIFNDASSGSKVGLSRAGSDYWLWQDLGGNRFWKVSLRYIENNDPSVSIHSLSSSYISEGPQQDAIVLQHINSTGAVWEYVFNVDGKWIGNGHGGDNQTGFSVEVDGRVEALMDGDSVEGESLTISRSSELYNDTGDKLADILIRYDLTPDNGLRVSTNVTFVSTIDDLGGYMAMGPFDDTLNVGSWVGAKQSFLLNRNDGSGHNGKSTMLYAFQKEGHYAFMLHKSDEDKAPVMIQDRAGGRLNKFYVPLETRSYKPGDTLSFQNTYKTVYLDDTAVITRQ